MSPDEPREPAPDGQDDEPRAPDDRDVRRALLGLADLIRRLEEEDALLRAAPYLLGKLGDLRHLLFHYEVRTTGRLEPTDDPVERQSRQVVREALERYDEMVEEWGDGGWSPPEEGDLGWSPPEEE